MSTNKMKYRIIEELKKAKEAEQITTEKTREIVQDAVAAAIAETKGGIDELRPLVKDAVAAAMEGLKDTGADAKETVDDCRCTEPRGQSRGGRPGGNPQTRGPAQR
jgi:hypothetical protein